MTACAVPGASPATDGAAPSAEPIVIEFLGSPEMDAVLVGEYARCMEENPGLERIQMQQQKGIQLLTAIAADSARVESNV